MNEPTRSQWQIRCAFNGFCKRTIRNEAINARKQNQRRQHQEVTFSNLTSEEEHQLYTLDESFKEEAEDGFCADGKKMTSQLLEEALRTLPEDRRRPILLYYFFEMSDAKIGKLLSLPRSTVQHRRTRALELLKQYLEENADEWNDSQYD